MARYSAVTVEEIATIKRLHAEGKNYREIAEITGRYKDTVLKIINCETKKSSDNFVRRNAKQMKGKASLATSSKEKFIDTGRVLPPINPPGPITVIHVDREHTELWLASKFGKSLDPIVSSLSARKPSFQLNCYNQL